MELIDQSRVSDRWTFPGLLYKWIFWDRLGFSDRQRTFEMEVFGGVEIIG